MRKNKKGDEADGQSTYSVPNTVIGDQQPDDLASAHVKDLCASISNDTTINMDNFILPVSDPAMDTKFIIMQPIRCMMAFARIIETLRLGCDHEPKVFDISFDVPSALRPVKEQKEIPHLMHVDILPWPVLRANFLKRMATINQFEFVADMQNDHLKVWGDEPDDMMGWEMSEEFIKKWWFLLDVSMLQTTNFWRRQQGLKALSFPKGWSGSP